MKYLLSFLFLAFTTLLNAQTIVDAYPYFEVDEKFHFQKNEGDYNLNNYTKLLLQKHGFETFLGKENMPEAVLNDNCKLLHVSLIRESNLFKTSLAIQFKNCKEQVVYTTPFATSTLKKYRDLYLECLRGLSKHLSAMNYNYVAQNSAVAETTSVKQTIQTVAEVNPKSNIVTPTNNLTFVAKQKPNTIDYDLFDSNNSLKYTLLYTGVKDVFLVKGDNKLCYKKDGRWVIADRSGNQLIVNFINIQF